MSSMDNSLDEKKSQVESPDAEVVDTFVNRVEQKGGEAAGTQPVGLSGSESVTASSDNAAPGNHVVDNGASTASPTPKHADSSMIWEYVGEMDVDPKSHTIMQGRKNAKTNGGKVKDMMSVRNPSAVFPIYEIYMDWDGNGSWGWDGAHRREVFEKLGRSVRVRVFRVKNAKKWAELHSCRANVTNGRDASTGDRRFQYEKACKLYHEEHGHYPNPNKLASMTLAKRADCVVFLREYLTKTDKPDKPSDDEPEQQQVIGKLQKVLAEIKKVNGLSNDWLAGDGVQDVLKEIAAEARRINVRQVKEPDVTPEQLKTFQQDNGLTMEKLGELLGVKHTTVSRWIRGKSKMTEHNQRAVRELLRLTSDQFANITEAKENANES